MENSDILAFNEIIKDKCILVSVINLQDIKSLFERIYLKEIAEIVSRSVKRKESDKLLGSGL